MPSFQLPRRRLESLLALVLLAASLGALARSWATMPERRAAERMSGRAPFDWRRATPEVRALERLLGAHGGALERGETVLVVARDPRGADAGFVWHWAQYIVPRVNFQSAEDVGPAAPAAHVLTWGEIAPQPAWLPLGAEGDFVLYEVER